MRRQPRACVLAIGAIACAALAIPAVGEMPTRLLWNASASVPLGLYAVRPVRIPVLGDLVVVRPPAPLAAFLADGGYLRLGVPLMKRVAALPGQRVCRHDVVVTVDGALIVVARERDRLGRALPAWSGCRTLSGTELLLVNRDEPASLDGRYFGPMPLAAVVGRAVPLWTDSSR